MASGLEIQIEHSGSTGIGHGGNVKKHMTSRVELNGVQLYYASSVRTYETAQKTIKDCEDFVKDLRFALKLSGVESTVSRKTI